MDPTNPVQPDFSNLPPQPSPLAIPPQPMPSKKKRPIKLIILICSVVLLLPVLIAFFLLLSQSKPTASNKPVSSLNSSGDQSQPATALDIEQTNNAIKQDASSLNDAQDFSSESLSDKTLGL